MLTPQETDELMRDHAPARRRRDVDRLHHPQAARGPAVADRITVIRRGKVVGDGRADRHRGRARLAHGRARRCSLGVDKAPAAAGRGRAGRAPTLRVIDDAGTAPLDGISFDVRARRDRSPSPASQGNGQTELTEASLGPAAAPTPGRCGWTGAELRRARRRRACSTPGVGFVPEDRQHDGLVGSFSIAENLVLDLHDASPFASRPRVRPGRRARATPSSASRSSTSAPPRRRRRRRTLSGGNQQKVVLAREMSRPLRLLVAAQPTRGVDVGSIEFVHQRIVAERDRGTAVVIVSTELDEVLALADRIVVHVPRPDRRRGRARRRQPRRPRPDDGRRAPPDEAAEPAEAPTATPAADRRSRDRAASRRHRTPPAAAPGCAAGRTLRDGHRASLIAALAVVLALVVGAVLIAVGDAAASQTPRATSSPARRHVHRGLGRRSRDAYSALFQGAVFDPEPRRHRGAAPAHRDADVRRRR